MQTEQEAKQVVANLRDKLAALENHRTDIETERDEISYTAIVLGDDKAKQRLAKISRTLIEHDCEIAAMSAAVRTAEGKVLEAQGVAKAEIERLNGEKALKLGRELLDCAKAADAGFAAGFIALSELRDTVQSLNRLGCGPNLGLVDANLKRSLISQSMGSGYALGHIPPGSRHTISELGSMWSATVQAFAADRLPKDHDHNPQTNSPKITPKTKVA
jgi:hypothetical protein